MGGAPVAVNGCGDPYCFLSIMTSHMFDDELEAEVTALKTSVISDPYDANRVPGCPKCSQVSFTLFLFMAPGYFPPTYDHREKKNHVSS